MDADWIEPSSRFLDFARSGRIKGFDLVNLSAGYGLIMIVSPHEVRFDDDQEA